MSRCGTSSCVAAVSTNARSGLLGVRAMQWASIRTSAHSVGLLLCSSLLRGLFSLRRVQPCADVRIGW
jgi:hypothetical protein